VSDEIIDPQIDGSAEMTLTKSVSIGTQQVKRCLGSLPEEQRKTFILRHQLDLGYDQIAAILNQKTDKIIAWLFRARVQLVKCLSQ
jgi:DNA-directed RNA polymerase specialized sigma24 family protein